MSATDYKVREAVASDAGAIRDLFQASYGESYCYEEFYDPEILKRLIFSDDTLMLVATSATGEVVATASVILEIGAFSDLVGEFGRLVVHPDFRNRRLGHLLMEGRLARVRSRLHIALMEARTKHHFSQRIAEQHGFAAVGYLPSKLLFAERESAVLLVQYFGECRSYRKNNPRLIPEAHQLAALALPVHGFPLDAIADEKSAAYPPGGDFVRKDLTTEGYSALLRIERGRVGNREIFGPMRLHYGFFRFSASRSSYLLACEEGQVAGAVGFMIDRFERTVRVFELIAKRDEVIRFLFDELTEKCRRELGTVYLEVDVSAHSPRMQRTLLELGFLPVGYVPCLAFDRVERLDIVKMARLLKSGLDLEGAVEAGGVAVASAVQESFRLRAVTPKVERVLSGVPLCEGLTREQLHHFACEFETLQLQGSQHLFELGRPADDLFVVLEGAVDIVINGVQVGNVVSGECLGEAALLTDSAHSATAVTRESTLFGVIHKNLLHRLIRRRPDIGTALYRNLAHELALKLRRADSGLAG